MSGTILIPSRLSQFHIVAPLYEKHFWPFADFRMGISKSDLVLRNSLLLVSETGADPAQNPTYAQDRVGGGLGAKPPENFWGPRPFYHGKRPYSLETRLEISFICYLVS